MTSINDDSISDSITSNRSSTHPREDLTASTRALGSATSSISKLSAKWQGMRSRCPSTCYASHSRLCRIETRRRSVLLFPLRSSSRHPSSPYFTVDSVSPHHVLTAPSAALNTAFTSGVSVITPLNPSLLLRRTITRTPYRHPHPFSRPHSLTVLGASHTPHPRTPTCPASRAQRHRSPPGAGVRTLLGGGSCPPS